MNDLIEALQLFVKINPAIATSHCPTHCDHDVLCVMGVAKDAPTLDQADRLEALGFTWMSEYEAWGSFRFGSA
jgi:hypothetical protein